MDKNLRKQINPITGPRSLRGAGLKSMSLGIVLAVSILISSLSANGLYAHPATFHTPAVIQLINPFELDNHGNGAVEKHVTCYPNPAISYINFKFDNSVPDNASLFIFSFTGRKMTETKVTGQVQKIPLDNYFRGLYVYQLRSAKGAILESGKFQVKN